MRYFLIVLIAMPVFAEDLSKSKSDLGLAHERIAWLESKLAATEDNSRKCFDSLNGIFVAGSNLLKQINSQEPVEAKTKEHVSVDSNKEITK